MTADVGKMVKTHVEHSEGFVKASSIFLDGLPILDKPRKTLETWLELPVKNVLLDII